MSDPSDGDHVLRRQRLFEQSPAEIYAAFAQAETLSRWWGPNGFTNTFESFTFEEGGHWDFVMHGPDGHRYPNRALFQSLEPARAVVIEHLSPPHFTLTITLSPHENGTLVQWFQAFEDARVAAAVRPIAEPGNEQNLDRLQALLRGRTDG